ncbi:nuclear protein localization protein 4 homolog isoform X2 [Homalodisca vitripennis]|uniref:nuclear protein localization protein 4 homolog isoform X1 n=1 Tax=Homalodisca vitripennis TaxID=197043 RepID=UPI001EEB106E|nr:nuclear protein localization protein 4 homolog isoform X1 [Homalodisca vitripennis]XP_046660207.1 nuclear protein localization protein 4 homolog isoform X2 [Homalodisca vitripennis]
MSKSKNIILRIQSPDGTKRIDVDTNDTTVTIFEKVHDVFSLPGFTFALYRQKNRKEELVSSRSRTVAGTGLRHGDMLYMVPLNGTLPWDQPGTSNSNSFGGESSKASSVPASPSTSSTRLSTNHTQTNNSTTPVTEDDVDLALWQQDGRLLRNRDKHCQHVGNSRCFNCSSIEPYDESYLREHNIKHMSFHAYLRKLTAGQDKGKYAALEDITCRIKPGPACKKHPPWPRGICSFCQPNAVTLNRQTYRHVDNVMFENAELVERFLQYWRVSGHQRLGFLYGRYETHADVPLGIRATVAAIYEPPQESSRDRIQLLPDEREQLVEDLAAQLGLRRVGWIFTDLLPEDLQKGTVKHVRNVKTHFLSAQECIMAGHYQNQFPNPCRFSSSGFFGSKFVTVCVTGDATNQVHMEGYSVSNQCMALVRDDCLVPTKDASELGYIRESSDKQYVPDVFYKEKDNYGNEVPRLARPLPVEYLLVDVPTSTPLTPIYTFHTESNITPFPIENRLLDGHIQDFSSLTAYLAQFSRQQFLDAASDFHFLLYIATMDHLPMKDVMGALLEAVRTRDVEAASDWAAADHWANLEQMIAASDSPPAHHGGGKEWTCPHCTFLNPQALTQCDMCRLPR